MHFPRVAYKYHKLFFLIDISVFLMVINSLLSENLNLNKTAGFVKAKEGIEAL